MLTFEAGIAKKVPILRKKNHLPTAERVNGQPQEKAKKTRLLVGRFPGPKRGKKGRAGWEGAQAKRKTNDARQNRQKKPGKKEKAQNGPKPRNPVKINPTPTGRSRRKGKIGPPRKFREADPPQGGQGPSPKKG